MCEPKATGIMPSFLTGRGQKREQPGLCNCHQPAPKQTPTEYAQKVLWTVGGIVLLASAGGIVRALAVGAVVIAALVVLAVAAGGGWLLWRRVRSLRQETFIPAPLPARPRTMVTDVAVQAIEPPPAAGPAPIRQAGRQAVTR